MVRPDIHTTYDWWLDAEVLLHRTQATVLDRGAPLDDAGDRGGSALGRLPKGLSDERARCLRGHSDLTAAVEPRRRLLDKAQLTTARC